MHGGDLALLVFAAFWAGAFVALLVRALIEDAAQRRLGRETVAAVSRDRLESYFGAVEPAIARFEDSWREGDWQADALPGYDPARGGIVIGRAPRLAPYDDSGA